MPNVQGDRDGGQQPFCAMWSPSARNDPARRRSKLAIGTGMRPMLTKKKNKSKYFVCRNIVQNTIFHDSILRSG